MAHWPCRPLSVATVMLALVAPALANAQGTPQSTQTANTLAPDDARELTSEEQTRLCGRAAALVASGYAADGEKLYKALLGRAPCAVEGVKAAKAAGEQPKTAEERVAIIRALQRQGFNEEARTELEKLVEETANDDPPYAVPPDLRAPNQQLGAWRGFLGRVGPAVVSALEAIAILLGLVVLAMVGRLFASRLRRQVELAPFEGADDDALPQSLASALQDHLAALRENTTTRQLQVQSAADVDFGKLPVPEVSALPQVNLIASLLSLFEALLPRRGYQVTGTIRPVDGERGAGITLLLANRHGKALAQQTVWEATYFPLTKSAPSPPPNGAAGDGGGSADDLAARYARLLSPASVWLAYRDELGFRSDKPPLQTSDWRSYAMFAAGEIAQREGRPGDARVVYERALDLDQGNLGAMLNLGSLMLAPPGGAESEADEKKRLARAARLLEYVSERSDDWRTALPYRARYVCTIAALYRGCLGVASDHITEVDRQMRRHWHDKALKPLLTALNLPMAALAESLRVLTGHDPDVSRFTKGPWLSAATEYNLACLYARWAVRPDDPSDGLKRLRKALAYLKDALERSPSAREEARLDPALKPLREDPTLKEEFAKLVRKEAAPEAAPLQRARTEWRRVAETLLDALATEAPAER
jgi:tetratricopeptide (TPR) repeat protein